MKDKTTPRDLQLVPTLLLGLIVLVVATVLTLWWWLGTESSLQWALRRAGDSQPITVQEAHGSLRTGATIGHLTWEREGLKVEAEQVVFAWRPIFLLGGTLKLDQIRAGLVRITDKRPPSQDPPKQFTSLPLPVQVDLDDLFVSRIEWVTAHTVTGENLAGRYWFDGNAHWLHVDSLQWAGASYRGKASLGAKTPLPLDATVSGEVAAPVPGASTLPVAFTATVTGPLENLSASAQVTALTGNKGTTQATATARITPWAAQPLPEAQATLQGLDLAAIWPQAPHTLLTGDVRVMPAQPGTWQASANLKNGDAGAWDAGRLPVESLVAQGEWRAGTALVKSIDAKLGRGTLKATGRWQQPVAGESQAAWIVNGTVDGVDPAALHTQMAATPVGGVFEVRQEGAAIAFDADLRGNGRNAQPAAAAKVAAPVAPVALARLKANGRWAGGLLSLPTFEARTRDASAVGSLELRPTDRAGSGKVVLQGPGFNATADGSLAANKGAGKLELHAGDLALARAWLARLPGVSGAAAWPALSGRADLALAWQGGWLDPALDATLASKQLSLQPAVAPSGPPAAVWSVNNLNATVKGRMSNAAVALRASARQGERTATIDTTATIAANIAAPAFAWRAAVAKLVVELKETPAAPGPWRLTLQAPVEARGSGADLDIGAGRAILSAPLVASPASATSAPATLSWDAVRRRAGELRTAGRLSGLPMSWLALVNPQLTDSALTGDMVFDAQWDASLGSTMRLDALLARTSGDVTVFSDTETGAAQRVAAGVRDARLAITSRGDQVTATLKWDSARAGTADGRLVTRLSPGGALGWQWAAEAPIDAGLRARLPRIGVWSLLAPPGWRLRGSLAADVTATGTRAAPLLAGTLNADDLALRSVVDGIELGDGKLRAQLDGTRIRISEFMLHGAGERGAGGTLNASGDVAWIAGAPQLQMSAKLNRLRASIRSDREFTVSGALDATMDAKGTAISGKLKVDQARIVLPDEVAPRLGDDVVVRGSAEFAGTVKERKADTSQERETKRPLSVAVDLDLGDDFRVSGQGLRTRLAGTLALSAQALTQPRLVGTIRAVGGEYSAFGQRLTIDRGVVTFSGNLANPALDILAIRPNLTQRVGVFVTGTVQAPYVRLYAEPDLPDAEKLAWLVTGRPAPETGAEAALVQQAALALLANRKPGSKTFASRVGLDDLSVRRDASAGAVVTVGKRFADNFYAAYERSLSGALGTLFVFYDISKKVTLRAQAGERTGVDLIYTFRFD
ncbi:MAG: translocation/assembly module TamB domain-containing protein [Ramlibacter sp.]|nr:translocation/assembly module TamB domain-containing protein [Ramlibacter sp.]